MNAKRLICVGGDNDQKSIVLEMGANRVIFARHTSSTCWYGHDTETILPDSEEHTIRRINFPDDKFVEVLGLSSLSDFEVFDLLVRPQGRNEVKMSKYRKKSIVIEATQWFKNGDHPADFGAETEGELVQYYRRPDVSGDLACAYCKDRRPMHSHGWINTLEGGHIVCPGDWIITGINGEYYSCKPDIFEATYEPA